MHKKKLLQSSAIILALNFWLISSSFAMALSLNSNSTNVNLGEAEVFVINRGIMKGDGNGNYFMSNNIKRGDLIVMLVRAFNFESYGNENFSDVPRGSYYYNAIATAKSMGFAKGYGKYFNPNKNVTLEEAILFIERAANMADGDITINGNINLRKIFSSDTLSEAATRQDIANLLYYAFTTGGNTINEEDPKIVYYTVRENKKIRFDENDFAEAYKNIVGGELDYIRLTQPQENSGKLYYDYSSPDKYDSLVDIWTDYYVDSAPGISRITFVPRENYTGTFAIKYLAFNNDGEEVKGTIKITVEDDGADVIRDIEYTTNPGKKIDFKYESFSKVFDKISKSKLEYIKFKLPSITYGKLYYLYRTASDYEALVKTTDKYYADESPSISDVTFVTRSDFLGTISIPYTAYPEEGDSYTGMVKITVEENEHIGDIIPAITYTTFKNRKIEFEDKDFMDAFIDTVDDKLFSVKFTLPSANCGTLYYDYASASKNNSLVKASTKYYVDAKPYLDDITFVPKTGYTGTVSIKYTAYNEDGDSYNGTVEIKVFDINSTITYTAGKNTEVKFNVKNFIDVFKKATNRELSHVVFSLPPTSCGRMYHNKISYNSYE